MPNLRPGRCPQCDNFKKKERKNGVVTIYCPHCEGRYKKASRNASKTMARKLAEKSGKLSDPRPNES